jgi:polysaccharide chain length determinant protein (PEP-CTERM system associated)
MQDILAQVYRHIWGVWRHRWLALIVAWFIAVAGWGWVWQMPESYVASARVYVDTNSILRPLLRGLTVQPNIDQRISMMSRTLLSRPNLEKLMRMSDLDLLVNTEVEKEEMLSRLGASISLSGARNNSSLYSISVRDEDRNTAKRIVQSLITIFVEESQSGKRIDSSDAQDFLDDQLADTEGRLRSSENRMAEFKQRNVDVLPGGGQGSYYTLLQTSRRELSQARLELNEMENRRTELQRQLNGEDPVFISSGVTGSNSMSPLDMRIQSLQVSLDGLLSQYTAKHPEVRQIRGLIEELEEEKSQEYSRVRESAASGFTGLSNSPVYQGMRSMLAESEASVAELRVRVAEFERRTNALEGKVNQIPEMEAELKQLDRDYNVIASQHQRLLERRESARLSQDVEQSAGDLTFRVVDPPFVPLKPSEPNKGLLNAAALLLGLASGVGAGLLVSLLAPRINDPRTLASVSGMPILGTVSLTLQPQERRRERYESVSFASIFLGLVVTYFALSLLQSNFLIS